MSIFYAYKICIELKCSEQKLKVDISEEVLIRRFPYLRPTVSGQCRLNPFPSATPSLPRRLGRLFN